MSDEAVNPADHLDRGTCKACGKRAFILRASRRAGGSFRRGHRNYQSPICGPCAASLAGQATTGHLHVYQWSVSGLERLLPQFVKAGVLPAPGPNPDGATAP